MIVALAFTPNTLLYSAQSALLITMRDEAGYVMLVYAILYWLMNLVALFAFGSYRIGVCKAFTIFYAYVDTLVKISWMLATGIRGVMAARAACASSKTTQCSSGDASIAIFFTVSSFVILVQVGPV